MKSINKHIEKEVMTDWTKKVCPESTAVHLTDVTLRDGLQLERVIPYEIKYSFFEKLVHCGYERLEITSFSHPKWMPQFADSEAFCSKVFSLQTLPNLEWMAFVPNAKGLDRLLKFPITWASAFIAASETFNNKNINASIEKTLKELETLVSKTHEARRKIRIYVSTVFGCPYEGAISDSKIFPILERVAKLGADEVALSDTIGVGLPNDIRRIVSFFKTIFPIEKTALHLHDTYGLALAGAEAGYQLGVRRFDGATGGVGGCPYAKGATGNVSIENLNYLFFRMGARSNFAAKEIKEALSILSDSMSLTMHSRLNDLWVKGGSLYGLRE